MRNINTTVPFNMNRCTEQFVTWCHVLNNTNLYLILLTYHPIQPKFTIYFFFQIITTLHRVAYRPYTAKKLKFISKRQNRKKTHIRINDSVITYYMPYALTQSYIFRCTYVKYHLLVMVMVREILSNRREHCFLSEE